jgi:hypothetical protein
MKINELIKEFNIYTTNEEKAILESMDSVMPLTSYTERERFLINNLIRKSLVSKIRYNNTIMVARNDQQTGY